MSTLQEQYLQVVQQGQEAVLEAVSSWTRTVKETTGNVPLYGGVKGEVSPTQAVDQAFDFAHKLLSLQHDFVKGLVQRSLSLSEDLANKTADFANHTADVAAEHDTPGL